MPLVSLLIATCNRLHFSKKYIPQIISRIGNISTDVLIWDNASNDGTLDWLWEYKKINPIIRKVLYSDENIGMEAYNYLANKTESKYIIKVDDDIEVPTDFVKRMVHAYETVKDNKLAYLGWDMFWTAGSSFATRSGLGLYIGNKGTIVQVSPKDRVLIHNYPAKFMVNGVCRLSLRNTFLELGGHPKGIRYGVDSYVSKRAETAGYKIGYLNSVDLIRHHGNDTDPTYKQFKKEELSQANKCEK